MAPSNFERYRTILGRAWRLRCPRCGQTKLYCRWFTMHERCAHCGLKYEREPGFFLGSVYINYGLTAVLLTAGYVTATLMDRWPQQYLLWTGTAFCIVFPLLFFRHARAYGWASINSGIPRRTASRRLSRRERRDAKTVGAERLMRRVRKPARALSTQAAREPFLRRRHALLHAEGVAHQSPGVAALRGAPWVRGGKPPMQHLRGTV